MAALRVVVCGTNYGQTYLNALASRQSAFALAGIIARGSARSRAMADELGVPLYRSPAELPAGIDVACVAVGDTPRERAGSKLAVGLLERGIHVIQEHPVYPLDVVRAIKEARARGVRYHVNTHFGDVEPVRSFITRATELRRRLAPFYIQATASAQCSYSLIDVLGRALGGVTPFGLLPSSAWTPAVTALNRNEHALVPFRAVEGVIAGVPAVVQIQNHYNPVDVGNNQLFFHRICLGTARGHLTLVNSMGPLVWAESPSTPGFELDQTESAETLASRMDRLHAKTRPLVHYLADRDSLSLREFTTTRWPDSVHRVLDRMRQEIETGAVHPYQAEEHILGVSKLWSDLMQRIGPPRLIELERARWEDEALPFDGM